MPNPVPQNDTTRLVIYAVLFVTIFVGGVLLVVLGKAESGDALQWVITGAGLAGTGLAGLKLAQDRRTDDADDGQ
ncbi:hypothetical protein R2360_00370 [Mycobacteroides chelonae]|uniref:hypothetical protein n=1 Tax=Mycobacteroides TaxID=670516 RepID=UPI000714A736|nr:MULTISPECIES: hypothetical protein [Mycobacteroides]MDM2382236.1 hypothetical protein [Mycobacteroides abscessus]MEC4838130.1 hypothetical protein [Mycobacteroides chelonae]KRQ24069.1 hypothetical protein AOT86_14885 [Mycobacteroides sp. H072]KRQ34601.1 hypothetical protein AOT84_17505 [Mycobacteroides sp. H002]KRQ55904.1 hypothetical protein AOT85_00565 [Mycobacteroides sp. H054]